MKNARSGLALRMPKLVPTKTNGELGKPFVGTVVILLEVNEGLA